MTVERDTSRIVRSWLREDEHESAERVLLSVLDRLDTTPQHRAFWPVWRVPAMNLYAKLGVGLAAVLVVVFIGFRLLPVSNLGPGGPTPPPTAAPTAAAIKTAPAATEPAHPALGPLAVGRYPVTVDGVRFTFEVATAGWSRGEFGFDKGPASSPNGAWLLDWPSSADGIFSDPCAHVKAPAVGPGAADMANAIAAVPGTELIAGPTAVTIGGRPAQYVAIRIADTMPCAPEKFFLWYDTTNPGDERYASAAGSTIRVWFVEVNGKRLQLEGETYKGAGAEIGDELQAIIDSIQFG